MGQNKKLKSSESASDGFQRLSDLFAPTATPRHRIALWLDQVEEKANAVIRPLQKALPTRKRDLAAALKNYEAARVTAKISDTAINRRTARKAVKQYIDASNALYPALWSLASNALRNAALVREKLDQGIADEAVEAALRTIHAAWELENRVLEKALRAGLKGHASWSRGGRKRAELMKDKLRGRNDAILQTRKAMKEAGQSFAESVEALAERHRLSKKQIKRILGPMDTC